VRRQRKSALGDQSARVGDFLKFAASGEQFRLLIRLLGGRCQRFACGASARFLLSTLREQANEAVAFAGA
jgi:hypothetical protein